MTTTRKTKKDNELARGYAYRLYMSGEPQKMIARTVGVTEATVSRWVTKHEWEKEREEQNTSTLSLANSLMLAAKKMAEKIVDDLTTGDASIDTITKCSDNLVKIMASAERIAKTVTKATIIDVIINLEKYLLDRAKTDHNLTPEVIQIINKYNKEYIKFISSQEA